MKQKGLQAMQDKTNNRLHWWCFGLLILFCFLIHFLVHLANTIIIQGFPMGFYVAAQLAPLALATIAIWFIARTETGFLLNSSNIQPEPDVTWSPGGAVAAVLSSGAVYLGLISAIAELGYDGLVFPLGLMGGFLCAALFFPQNDTQYLPGQKRSIPNSFVNFIHGRFLNWPLTVFSAAIAILCLLLLIAAEFTALKVFANWFSIPISPDIVVGVLAILVGVSALFFPCSWLARAQTITLVALLIGLTFSAGLAAWQYFASPLPQLSYGHALSDIATLEQSMIENQRADPGELNPFIRPNTHFDSLNFFSVIACMMLGVAALVHILVGPPSGPARKKNGRSLIWGVILVVAICLTAPAVAAFAKLDIYRAIEDGVAKQAPPDWIAHQKKRGIINVCDASAKPDSKTENACASSDAHYALQDLQYNKDAILMMAQEIRGLPNWLIALIAAIFSFAIVTNAISLTKRIVSLVNIPQAAPLNQVVPQSNGETANRGPIGEFFTCSIAAALAVTAGFAISRIIGGDVISFAAWSFTFAAAGLFPILFFARAWMKTNPWALLITAALSVGLCAYYIVATTSFASSFVMQWSDISNAPPWRLDYLKGLMEECRTAGGHACDLVTPTARSMANWWGVDNYAVAILTLPPALFIVASLSLVLPNKRMDDVEIRKQ